MESLEQIRFAEKKSANTRQADKKPRVSEPTGFSAIGLAMAKLAVRQNYLNMRMKGMRARIDNGERPEPIREELKKCLDESVRIDGKLAVYYRSKERKAAKAKAGRVKAVKEAAKEKVMAVKETEGKKAEMVVEAVAKE